MSCQNFGQLELQQKSLSIDYWSNTYSNHGSGLLDDHEPGPVAVLDVLAEGALDDHDELPVKNDHVSRRVVLACQAPVLDAYDQPNYASAVHFLHSSVVLSINFGNIHYLS